MGRYKLRRREVQVVGIGSGSMKEKQSDESDEDHNKIWCICRQPQGDRFMIRCDGCREWFHGECVSVTKKGSTRWTSWHCPDCKKASRRRPAAPLKHVNARKCARMITSGNSSRKSNPASMIPLFQAGDDPAGRTFRTPTSVASASSPKGDAESNKQICVACKSENASQGSQYCSTKCEPRHEVLIEQQQKECRDTKHDTTQATAPNAEGAETRAVTEDLEAKFACCNCKKWPMLIPIYQCFDGHAICNPCSSTMKICRTCGVRLPDRKIRAPAIEAVQPGLTKCIQVGCEKVFANQADMEEHTEIGCVFRTLPICKIMGLETCDATSRPVDIEGLVRHLKEEHAAMYVQMVNGQAKHSGYCWPSISCVVHRNSLVIVINEYRSLRRLVKVFSFGERSDLQKLTLAIDTKLKFSPRHVCFTADNVHLNRMSVKLMPFASKDAETYKAMYTFDIGSRFVVVDDFTWRISTSVSPPES